MAERSRARHVEEEKVEVVEEEESALALYKAMLGKVDEMYVIVLKMESGPQAVLILSAIEMVKAQVDGAVEKMREAELIEAERVRYEEREVVKDGTD